jgi:hypothetical protein
MLGLLSALLAGMLAFFSTGTLLVEANVDLGSGRSVVIRATGGLGAAVGILFWWERHPPIVASSVVAQQLQTSLAQAPAVKDTIPATAESSRTRPAIAVPEHTQELARDLAEADPRYVSVRALSKQPTLSPEEYRRVTAALPTQARGMRVPLPTATEFLHSLDTFTFEYDYEDVNGRGPRRWVRRGNAWVEFYPNGDSAIVHVMDRIAVDGDSGTLARSGNGGRYEYFIPDAGSNKMWLRIRLDKGEWSYLGEMKNIQPVANATTEQQTQNEKTASP